jgi:hypothetical protein
LRPGLPVRSLLERGQAGANRPSELCEQVTDRLPFVGRLVRDQLGQASLEVALDLAHELLSLVGGLDDGVPAISLGTAAVSKPRIST